MRRFTHIYLRNWRNFTKVDADLQRRVVLVGPNGSGKSNFLDVFRFLHDIVAVGGGFQQAVQKRGGVSRLRCLAARESSDITVRIMIGDENPNENWEWQYELSFNQDRLREPAIKKERVIYNGESLLERPDSDDKKDPKRQTQTYLEQVYANQRFRDIADFFSSIRYLHVVPQLVREPDRSIGKSEDPYGGDFLEQIARMKEPTQKARLRRIKDTLRLIIPQLEDLKLERDARGTPHLLGKYKNWRPRGTWLDEVQLSDGTLRLMGLLWAALNGNGPLLLEEPELSLHPAVVSAIPQLFANLQSESRYERQFLISTHSADFLRDSGWGLDEVLLLEPRSEGSEGTSITSADKFEQIRHLLDGGLSLADAVIPETAPKEASQLVFFAKA